MDYGGVRVNRGERMMAGGEEEEVEGKMGIIANFEENLGNLRRGETMREEREKSRPTRFRAVVG